MSSKSKSENADNGNNNHKTNHSVSLPSVFPAYVKIQLLRLDELRSRPRDLLRTRYI